MKPKIALLGTGVMGTGMAHSLLRANLTVVVWNRHAERSRPLADAGALVAATAAEAVADANVVITSLFDADAVEQTMCPVLDQLSLSAVWVQSSTVGIVGAQRLARLAHDAGVGFVDAPFLGTKAPAENGSLVVLASGRPELRARTAEVFEAIGSKTFWISDVPGDASRLKLIVNAWVGVLVSGTAQSVAMARALGLDPRSFLDVIAGQAVDSPYAQAKGRMMIDGDFKPSFALDGLLKDTELIIAAQRAAGMDPVLATAIQDRLAAASAQGFGHDDIAAVVRSFAV